MLALSPAVIPRTIHLPSTVTGRVMVTFPADGDVTTGLCGMSDSACIGRPGTTVPLRGRLSESRAVNTSRQLPVREVEEQMGDYHTRGMGRGHRVS